MNDGLVERRPSPKGCREAARLKRSEVIDPETGEPLTGTDTHDWKNRLIRRTTSEGRIIDITYNALGDRITKSTGISTVHYLVDRNNLTGYAQVVEELDSSLTVERAYIYGLDLIAQSQLMPPEDPSEWQISYYLYDGLGTVRGLVDATGLVTDAYFYDAYGVLLNVIGVTPNAYLYTGEQYDPDLGMYFLRARYLNPNTGRFHTMDTFEGVRTDPQSLHKYLYAHANPVMGVDPSGNETVSSLLNSMVIGQFTRKALVQGLSTTLRFVKNVCKLTDAVMDVVDTAEAVAGIYMIITPDGKNYIGSSTDMEDRMKQHKNEGDDAGKLLKRDGVKIVQIKAEIPLDVRTSKDKRDVGRFLRVMEQAMMNSVLAQNKEHIWKGVLPKYTENLNKIAARAEKKFLAAEKVACRSK